MVYEGDPNIRALRVNGKKKTENHSFVHRSTPESLFSSRRLATGQEIFDAVFIGLVVISAHYVPPSKTCRCVFSSPGVRASSLISDGLGGFCLARRWMKAAQHKLMGHPFRPLKAPHESVRIVSSGGNWVAGGQLQPALRFCSSSPVRTVLASIFEPIGRDESAALPSMMHLSLSRTASVSCRETRGEPRSQFNYRTSLSM
jgi:hypothetical protein